MDSENQETLYYEDDEEYRVYCDICDKLSIQRYYKNHLKSQTHTNNKHKKIISNKSTKVNMTLLGKVCDRSTIENESEY